MRISYWSSDVCSSDLPSGRTSQIRLISSSGQGVASSSGNSVVRRSSASGSDGNQRSQRMWEPLRDWHSPSASMTKIEASSPVGCRSEERRVGKSVSVRVDLGGRRIMKKKIQLTKDETKTQK